LHQLGTWEENNTVTEAMSLGLRKLPVKLSTLNSITWVTSFLGQNQSLGLHNCTTCLYDEVWLSDYRRLRSLNVLNVAQSADL
jgi:hypothetical protein